MKYQNLFLILYCAIATPFSHAMENKNFFSYIRAIDAINNPPINFIREITAIKGSSGAQYITKNSALISDVNHKCSIVDLNTQQTHALNKSSAFPQVNNKKIMIYDRPQLIMFDAENKVQEWSIDIQQTISNFAWTPLNNTVFLCYDKDTNWITKYNYCAKTAEHIPVDKSWKSIAMHPKQEIMCVEDYFGNISLHHVSNAQCIKKITPLSSLPHGPLYCHYTFNGTHIIAGDEHKLYIINPNINSDIYPCIEHQKNPYECFYTTTIHPTMPILAILCKVMRKNRSVLRYFNINKQQPIEISSEKISAYGDSLDFSPDGFEIMITVEGKCVEMSVPFAIKAKCLFSLFALKHINDRNQNDHLPQDITNHCAKMLLNTFKF